MPNSKLYINNNLCPFYANLRFNCKLLFDDKLIFRFWSFGGVINICIKDGDARIKIRHPNDLVDLFPTYGKFKFGNAD